MSTTPMLHILSPLSRLRSWLGLAIVAALAGTATWMADVPAVAKLGLSPLTLAIVLGMCLGNTYFKKWAYLCGEGVDFSKNVLLRAGIILYGFRITLQQVLEVGWRGMAADLLIVCSIFALALAIGHWLRVDRETAILIGAGSSICGAAAVMATEPVLKASPAKVSVAIATVVLFGTLSMFLYPLLQRPFHLSDSAYGLFVGSTVHEVAQVVAASKAASEEAATVAVIVKMLRVMMLAPFLTIASLLLSKSHQEITIQADKTGKRGSFSPIKDRIKNINVPWFAVMFLLMACLHSTGLVPPTMVRWLITIDTILLAMAMSALGMRTQASALRAAGARPMILSALLFLALIGEGLLITKVFETL